MDKSSSFSSRNNVCTPKQRDKDLGASSRRQQWKGEEEATHEHDDLPQILEDVDHFLGSTTPREVPDFVHVLTRILDSMVDKYNAGKSKLGQEAEDDKSFLDVVDRISKFCATSSAFPCPCAGALDKTSSVLEKAMSFLEKHLCALLQDPKSSSSNNYHCDFQSKTKTPKKSSSFSSLIQVQDNDLCAACAILNLNNESPTPPNAINPYHQDQDQNEDFPAFSPERVSLMNKIATAMVTAGYQTECCMAFASFRRSALKAVLQSFGYGSLSMEEIHRMQWESLEGEIATWNRVVRHCTTVLFNAEGRLYVSVFPNQHSIAQSLFSDLVQAIIGHFLNFAQGVVLTKPSAEKLFKFLDMYETLRDVELGIADGSYTERCAQELAHETATAKIRIAEAAVAMFCDLENSLKGDNERIPVPNGAIHPLTRYVMNYLEYACEYKDTLGQVLQQCLHVNHKSNSNPNQDIGNMELDDDGTPKSSPFAVQLMTIMDLLNANVESKSKLYRNPALRYVFLMNNGRYIAQKVKGCAGLHESMGNNWCRRRQSGLRLYHKSYQRETWSKVLRCLNPEGLQGSGSGNKVSKQELKERFKCFNGMFEDIHKTQSTWVVSDVQLQSELRVSISALVIPAYRSFFGRFKHHLQSSRHVDKYIKYHPEDIETLIEDLFDGGSTSMARRRT